MKFFMVLSALLGMAAAAQANILQYQGSFRGTPGTLTITPIQQSYEASFVATNGQQGLFPGCQSQIGRVLKIKENNGVLRRIVFSFDRGYCKDIRGSDLTLDFKNNRMSAWVLEYYQLHQPPCTPDWQGHNQCPMPEERPVYATGEFVRQ
ncbi:MAG: hypothetical protein COT73_11595 [Bdellovibrio sp. CG10_big_fil_rev_8_21_14_0_10_47_8]|nr:MAG: hypothetical protein COT73_11595 [Bdellovibrio sp. CG10_big_fil_rev_8_21_14_0_10_47_8]